MSANKEKPDSHIKLFGERMKREGRWTEFQNRIKAVKAETGKQWGPAQWVAMREFGYVDAKAERKLYEEFLHAEHHDIMAEEAAAEMEAEKSALLQREFDEVVATLPANADVAKELAWIESHPAMRRLSRNSDQTAIVLIDVEDLMAAPHGECPSQAAANALQHWANNVSEFHKYMMSEKKKKTEDEDKEVEAIQDKKIDEIHQILDSVQNAQ